MSSLAFWASAMLLALLALPLAFAFFRRFPDAGAGLAFPLGLTLAAYGYFILRILSVLPPGRGGYVVAVGLFALLAVVVARRDRRFLSTLRRVAPALGASAGLFTVLFFAFAAFRSYTPDITGTEQPMDFMYLNAMLVSPDYPPHDPWLAGERASYYYFGYLQVGVLTALSGVQPSEGYNLGLAYTFGAAGTAIASLAFALVRWTVGARGRRWALAAAGTAVGLLLFVGSLAGVFEYFAAHERYSEPVYSAFGVDWLLPCPAGQTETAEQKCYDGPVSPRTTEWYPTQFFWWFSDTRLIPDTITETPFFSFLLGDLHPHVMSIPLVVLALAFAASIYRGRRLLTWREHLRRPAAGIALALIFGALAFTNAWDILTFSTVFAAAVIALNLRRAGPAVPQPAPAGRPWSAAMASPGIAAIVQGAGYLAPIFALAILAYLPWYLDFSSQADGIHAYTGAGTRPAHAFLQFGALLLAAVMAAVYAFRGRPAREVGALAVNTAWVPLLPLVAWLAFTTATGDLPDAVRARHSSGWLTLGLYAAATWLLVTAFVHLVRTRPGTAPAAGFAATGALLLLGAELFFIGDVFRGNVPRLNTVFKLGYQAWILLATGGAVALVLAFREAVSRRRLAGWCAVPVAAIALAGLATPLLAIPNRTAAFGTERNASITTSLDGLAGLARNDPDEYALTRWLQDNTDPGAVIIEASGRGWVRNPDGQLAIRSLGVDYTDASRIASRTGRRTPIGWPGHEVQWRGDTEANKLEFGRRQDAIDRQVYLTRDPAEALATMRSFGATYVVVGSIELRSYPADALAPFADFLDVVFTSGPLRVYRVPQFTLRPTS